MSKLWNERKEATVSLSDKEEVEKRYDNYNTRIIEEANIISYISDMETYDLIHMTKAGMKLYGMKRPEEYQGKKCYEVVMGLEQPCSFCANPKLKEGQEYRYEKYNEKIKRWFDRRSSIIQIDDRPCHLEIGYDITARKEELSVLSEKLTMEDVLFRCLHTLTREKDMERAVYLFLEAVGGYHKADRAYLFELNEEEGTIYNSFEWYRPELTGRLQYLGIHPFNMIQEWEDKFRTEGGYVVTSIEEELDHTSFLYREMKADHVDSFMIVPVFQGEKIVGLLGVNNPRRERDNVLLLSSVSEFVYAELERRYMIRELEHMSYTDTLTGLKNRNHYNRILKEYEHRTPDSLGIIFVDINGMKGINDIHGFQYGDHVIKKTGKMFSEILGEDVFRIGGDEFVALVENIDGDEFRQKAINLRSAFECDRECNVAIGCAWKKSEENIQILLRQASELLAADKKSYYHTILKEGRGEVSSGFSGEVIREVEEGRFIVFYQPQVDIKTGKITGAEALVRKLDENGTIIPPNKFVPFYEMEGVISYVDLFVLKSACESMAKWQQMGYEIHMSINFSRVTLLEPDIVECIKKICKQSCILPKDITIEVTESISKMGEDRLKELIQEINAAGFTISLDDFGSQYSNLAILSSMDFDEIKFDKSLVEELEYNPKSRIVMENTVNMCRALNGITSLAEGIETKGQLELLMGYQCDHGQGYYFSKPVPEEEFFKMLSENFLE